MREILFKAKRKDNNKWTYGDLIIDQNTYFIGKNDCNEVGDVWYERNEVIPKTICQYTGLKDKNSKMIFENDNIKYASKYLDEIGVVTYNQTNASYQIKGIPSSSMKHHDRIIDLGNVFDEVVDNA